MAAESQLGTGSVKNYPVWVGSLRENVTAANLDESFRHLGGVVNCTVMVDEQGKSKYVIKAFRDHIVLRVFFSGALATLTF